MPLVGIGLFLPQLAAAVRRLHDTNRTVKWLLVTMIPLLGTLAFIIVLALKGTAGANRFGPDPHSKGGA